MGRELKILQNWGFVLLYFKKEVPRNHLRDSLAWNCGCVVHLKFLGLWYFYVYKYIFCLLGCFFFFVFLASRAYIWS